MPKNKIILLIFSILIGKTALANPIQAGFNVIATGAIATTEKGGPSVYTHIVCRRGAEVCHFTSFYEGKADSYDPLVPWFFDDDVTASNMTGVSIVYQTGDIVRNDQIIGLAHTINHDGPSKSGVEFFVPITVDRENRTIFIGQ